MRASDTSLDISLCAIPVRKRSLRHDL